MNRFELNEKLYSLADELCASVDSAAEDVGGHRAPVAILQEIGPTLDALKKIKEAAAAKLILPESIVSDAEIDRVHARANFGNMSKRKVVDLGVTTYAFGYASGHTQLQILIEHKLVCRPRGGSYSTKLTKKGIQYFRSLKGDLSCSELLTAMGRKYAPDQFPRKPIPIEDPSLAYTAGWYRRLDELHPDPTDPLSDTDDFKDGFATCSAINFQQAEGHGTVDGGDC